ncbi:MAG: glycosyltransferase family 2 protein [Bacteroidales bacterium]|nr:glycosyltransferase family 2 protein [Bacteroidales bacterium]
MEKNFQNTKIAIIILSYNGQGYLPDLFKSLREQTLKPSEVVIVDNNSSDDSVDYIKKNFSEATLVVSKKNTGFARGNNIGIKKALENNPDYIFMLNQDTVCDKECLEILAREASSSGNLFACQPLIMCWPEKKLIQTSGNKMHFLGFGYSGDYKKEATDKVVQKLNRNPFYLSGAAMFIDVNALKKIGLLDEDLFLYHEDTDICLRAKFLGYQMKLIPEAIIYHKYTEAISKNRWFWSERNRPLTLLKFYKLPTLILIFPLWFFMELGVLFYSLIDGWLITKAKSSIASCSLFSKTFKKRAQIQKTRQIKDREFVKNIEPCFNFAGFEHPLIKYIVNPVFGFFWKIIRFFIFW